MVIIVKAITVCEYCDIVSISGSLKYLRLVFGERGNKG